MSFESVGLKVFVGYDSREDIAWQVCRHSIERLSSDHVRVFPLRQDALRELGLYTRPQDVGASTEFSLTRFLSPYVSAHDGWTLFVDCDFVFTRPLDDLLSDLVPGKAAYVVQHDYTPARQVKMDGRAQAAYPRKNWSSFMLFDCTHPAVRRLTPDVVNAADPAFLHRLQWLADDEIGALHLTWNFLEGEYPVPNTVPNAVHFTNGGPWFDRWQNVSFADIWCQERDRYLWQTRLADAAEAAE